MTDTTIEVEVTEEGNIDLVGEDIGIENLPFHALKKKAKEMGIKLKNTDKKADIIEFILDGGRPEPKKKKPAPRLKDQKKPEAINLGIPAEILPQLEAMKARGLSWEVQDKGVEFSYLNGVMTNYANLDQPAAAILRAAEVAFGGSRVPFKGDGVK